jgi:hypothetical protein
VSERAYERNDGSVCAEAAEAPRRGATDVARRVGQCFEERRNCLRRGHVAERVGGFRPAPGPAVVEGLE